MKKLILFLLCLLLVITGCTVYGKEEPVEEGADYVLYFRERELSSAAGEGALRTETVRLDTEGLGAADVAKLLMAELLRGPRDTSLKNTIPAGALLVSLELEGTRAAVDLSAPYGTLSGVGLTLADQAIALTLTQLPEILTVKITVHGRELSYRDRQLFSGRDVLLAPEGDVVSTMEAVLYFLNHEGKVTAESRTLELYEGDTQVGAVVQALEDGPAEKELLPILPEGFRVKSVWLEENVCYANLSSGHLETVGRQENLQVIIDAIARSLCSLESVHEVRFLVDGDFAETYGMANVSKAYMD